MDVTKVVVVVERLSESAGELSPPANVFYGALKRATNLMLLLYDVSFQGVRDAVCQSREGVFRDSTCDPQWMVYYSRDHGALNFGTQSSGFV